ncbi:hypothetical protein HPP92_016129 [Vanilla planifolia]|uniref:Uncharacterized protein n=1 Tax=Vanilla planifolia TaxID=51239 RepID=A0A835QHI6_VANPL|nr:hypothetical protein HPP92_016731 [Vanilla planifolia]KAG0471583.1 hypothetical protein HPP92_016129 [Vanilla planifolia]
MIYAGYGSSRTHYEVLLVGEDASYDEIRANYKAAVLSSHPDKLCNRQMPDDTNEAEQERFLSVQKAWEVLSDPNTRENYDRQIQASRNQVEVVDDEISLAEMTVQADGDVKQLFYMCRCGDHFSITSNELEEIGVSIGETEGSTTESSPASVVLHCGSCSLKVRLMIDVNS